MRGTRRRPARRSGWARGASSALRPVVGVDVVVAAGVKAEVVAAVWASAPRAPASSPVQTRCGPPPPRVSLSFFSPPPKTPKALRKTRWKTRWKTTMGAGVLMWEGAPLLCCSRLPAAERASVFCAQGTTPPPPTPQRRCSSSGRTQRERKRARKRPFEGRRQVKSRVLARPPRPACPPRPRCPPSGPLRSTPPTTAAAAAAAAPSPYLLTCLVLCPYPAPSRCGLGRSTFATMRRAPLGGASSSLLLLAVLLLGAGAAHAAVVAVERTLPARADVFLIGGEPFALEAGATFTVDITTTVGAPAVDACVRPLAHAYTHSCAHDACTLVHDARTRRSPQPRASNTFSTTATNWYARDRARHRARRQASLMRERRGRGRFGKTGNDGSIIWRRRRRCGWSYNLLRSCIVL